MIRAVHNLASRLKRHRALRAAKEELSLAHAAYRDAISRNDTRAMNRTLATLQRAQHAYLRLEIAR